MAMVADEMRRRQVGDVVTYVVNRNINFTNVCIKHCAFCAFNKRKKLPFRKHYHLLLAKHFF